MSLLQAIEQTFCKLQDPSLEELQAALHDIEGTLGEVPAYATEPQQLAYGRNVIYSATNLEVIVIHIPAFEATAIHNHGPAIGAACLIRGSLLNTKYHLDTEGYPISHAEDRILAGEYFTAPKEQIHQLSNPGQEPAVSLHVYCPPLRQVERYLPYSEILDYVI
ncbi:cysteine dioxygenase [Paenibacillus marchantiophytorum]|uniref:Cysteine dioxygenase n=1 Tax=Paenibacillus marchantiophytorum TaxID=1619310 RepID=A0ABQ1F6S0_9BACL|nr:cysteine dioxygenase family protein [Paenibacillus marchantiophytorum]GGA01697.1 cysteine dioxygenase [Paenibacillus marchantiophytorum]